MSKDTQSEVYTKRKRGINEVGHWQMPLDGHGLAYFDELTVAYRTIPSHGVTEDPWARAAAILDFVRIWCAEHHEISHKWSFLVTLGVTSHYDV